MDVSIVCAKMMSALSLSLICVLCCARFVVFLCCVFVACYVVVAVFLFYDVCDAVCLDLVVLRCVVVVVALCVCVCCVSLFVCFVIVVIMFWYDGWCCVWFDEGSVSAFDCLCLLCEWIMSLAVLLYVVCVHSRCVFVFMFGPVLVLRVF